MKPGKATSFLLVAAISIFSIIISYTFGNGGYEAFITLSLALGVLLTWQLLQLLRLLFHSKIRIITRLASLALIGLLWVVAISGVMLSVSRGAFGPTVDTPDINWVIVAIGTAPYILPGLIFYKTDANLQKTAVGILTTLYSVLVILIAAIGYYSNRGIHRELLLVLAL